MSAPRNRHRWNGPGGLPSYHTKTLKEIARIFVMYPDEAHYVSELRDSTGIASGTISPLLKCMTSVGWLTQDKTSEKNGKTLLWYRITPEGEDYLSAIVWEEK